MHSYQNVVVRVAEARDIARLCRLYFDFHEYHVRGVPDRLVTLGPPEQQDSPELTAKLNEIIKSSESELFIAELAGDCIGFAEVYIREDLPDPARVPHRFGHLQSLLVSEPFRATGVGTSLLEAAEGWALEHGATEMRLDTWEFPGDPVGFYERNGYRTLRRQLVREFDR